jgi:hypothetical protein
MSGVVDHDVQLAEVVDGGTHRGDGRLALGDVER